MKINRNNVTFQVVSTHWFSLGASYFRPCAKLRVNWIISFKKSYNAAIYCMLVSEIERAPILWQRHGESNLWKKETQKTKSSSIKPVDI